MIAYDTFTDTDSTLLQSHTGEIGATWTKPSNAANSSMVTGNRLRSAASGVSNYLPSGLPAGQEYDVECDIVWKSAVGTTGLVARQAAATDTSYHARYNAGNANWELIRINAGTATTLGQSAMTLTANQAYRLKLVCRNGSKKLFVDGVELLSSTDNTIASGAGAGVRLSGSAGSAIGVHLDNFMVGQPSLPLQNRYQRNTLLRR